MALRLEIVRGKSPEAAVAAANEKLNTRRDARETLDVVTMFVDPGRDASDVFVVVLRHEVPYKRVFEGGEEDAE